MRIRGLSIAYGLLVMIVMVSCAAESRAVEPAAAEMGASDGAGPALAELAQSGVGVTAVPMPLPKQDIVAGETNVVVEAPEISEQRILPAEGDALREEAVGAAAGETIAASGSNQAKVDISSKEGRIAFAQDDLSDKLAVGLAEVEFLSYENKIWPDGNLGCPGGGKRFTPVEIPGYLIRLKVGAEEYAYHGGAGRIPFLCDDQASNSNAGREIILPPPDPSP